MQLLFLSITGQFMIEGTARATLCSFFILGFLMCVCLLACYSPENKYGNWDIKIVFSCTKMTRLSNDWL